MANKTIEPRATPTAFFPTADPDGDTVLLLGVPPQILQLAVDLIDNHVTGKNARTVCNALERCVPIRVPKDQLPKLTVPGSGGVP